MAAELAAAGIDDDTDVGELNAFGVAAHDLAYARDVSEHLALKRAAMAAHRSQIGPESFFLALSEPSFAAMFGNEWYAVRGQTATGGRTGSRCCPDWPDGGAVATARVPAAARPAPVSSVPVEQRSTR